MIATVTLNPAIDKVVYLPTLNPGVVNRADRLLALPGGKGINIALMLNRLGQEVVAMGMAGGFIGEFVETSLASAGVFIAFQHLENQSRTNFIVVEGDGEITQVLEPGPLVSDREVEKFLSMYDRTLSDVEMVLIGGTCPPGCPPDIYKEMVIRAKNKGIKTILNAYGESFEIGLEAAPDIVKPDLRFSTDVFEHSKSTAFGRRNISEKLLGMGVKIVAIAYDGLNHHVQSRDDIFNLQVAAEGEENTVIAGDAFLAGLLDGLGRDLPLRGAMEWAAAMELAASQKLEKRWANVSEIEMRLSHVTIEAIDEG